MLFFPQAQALSLRLLAALALAAGVPGVLGPFSSVALADVFIWRDPQTGGKRMSNTPPPWLREGRPGPKIEVIRGNKVIDAATAFATPQAVAQPSPRQLAAGVASAIAAGRKPEVVEPPEPEDGEPADVIKSEEKQL